MRVITCGHRPLQRTPVTFKFTTYSCVNLETAIAAVGQRFYMPSKATAVGLAIRGLVVVSRL